jgi:hypothetical protein
LESNVATQTIQNIDVFNGANHFNPGFDTNGHIIFLSDRDGFRNLYRYDPTDRKVYQMTDLLSGISGITAFAPAMHIGKRGTQVAYTFYSDKEYHIYSASLDQFLNLEVNPEVVDQTAAIIYPVNSDLQDVSSLTKLF